jgi:hypothetical protein
VLGDNNNIYLFNKNWIFRSNLSDYSLIWRMSSDVDRLLRGDGVKNGVKNILEVPWINMDIALS